MDEKQRMLFESLNENVTLNEMQAYIKNIISIRVFSEQKVQDTMLLLFEETGELAKAIRKTIPNFAIDYKKIELFTIRVCKLSLDERRL